jgi:acetyl-CoA C-acetyltransferase
LKLEVYIAAAVRTPIGGLAGTLSSLPATKLGSIAIKAALERSKINPELVDEVYMGNVLSAGVGQAPARQAALGAGLPHKVCTTTINKVCASGAKAIALGAQSILLGTAEIVIAGGMESMSNTPYYLPKARSGFRYGNGEIIDGIVKDGLSDAFKDCLMGNCAELLASDMNFSREDQDTFAISSYQRAQAAQKNGWFDGEIIPVEIPGTKGAKPTIVSVDEEASKPLNEEKLRAVAPAFKKENGTVTSPNSSTISDGAAALVLISGEKARELGINVIAKIRGWADAEQSPEYFTTSPALAIPKALKHAGLTMQDVDFFEINEAFSVVALANQKKLGIDPSKLNVYGGAVSLGHPLGCSGARIVVTLSSVLKNHNAKIGVAVICNGGGGASCVVIERVNSV